MNLLDALTPDMRAQLTPEVCAPILVQATRLFENLPFGIVRDFIQLGLAAVGTPAWEAEIASVADRLLAAEDVDELFNLAEALSDGF